MICLGFQKVSNCYGWNVELENPPTVKRRDDVSRGNFRVDATPNKHIVLVEFNRWKLKKTTDVNERVLKKRLWLYTWVLGL